MRFGKIQFGDSFETAAFLGRPDHVSWIQKNYCALVYASGGFQIDYDNAKFVYLAFYIGLDDFVPKQKPMAFSKPKILGCEPGRLELSSDIDRLRLEGLFGTAKSVDVDDDETILYYSRQGITMEFELDANKGRLKRWNLYPD